MKWLCYLCNQYKYKGLYHLNWKISFDLQKKKIHLKDRFKDWLYESTFIVLSFLSYFIYGTIFHITEVFVHDSKVMIEIPYELGSYYI